ncbi:MAG: hypothetical protein ACR2IE_16915 [Candidatus Sumerlaeaceae bacterium]
MGLRLSGSAAVPGGKHEYMTRAELVLTIPKPHAGDIGIDLLPRLWLRCKPDARNIRLFYIDVV